MSGPLLGEVVGGLGEADSTAATSFDPVEDVGEGWPFGETGQLAGEILLEGLAALLGAMLQGGVNGVGDVADENVGHAFIMLSLVVACNSRHHGDPGDPRQ
jgi:hypothetical protein